MIRKDEKTAVIEANRTHPTLSLIHISEPTRH